MDAKTRMVLARLSADAPALAEILTKALRDGVISPETVAALERAVDNINEDVASALLIAGQNINEDVADSLREAGSNINDAVADKILMAATIIREAVGEGSFTSLVESSAAITNAVDRIESASASVVAAPSARKSYHWRAGFWTFMSGTLFGVLIVLFLLHGIAKR
jgi:hypothetical protein